MPSVSIDAYKEIEEALIAHLLDKFDGYVTSESVVGGELDKLLHEMMGEGTRYGILLEFGGGERPERGGETFKGRIWEWSIVGVVMIKYVGDLEDIESNLRTIVGILRTLFDQDHTLGGVTPKIDIIRIASTEIMNVNDTPMYWLPFEITARDKLRL